jgi:hypothetical protein
MRTILALLALVLTQSAAAQELRIREVLVCETGAQIKRLVELGANGSAMIKVNAESGSADTCVVTTAAFVATDRVAEVRRQGTTYVILRLMVFGLGNADGIHLLPRNAIWYTLVRMGSRA